MPSTANPKVIKIIDEYKLVINQGKNDFVKDGDVFEIYEVGQHIIDPETGFDYGTLDYVKAKIRVENVYDNMSLCANAETVTKEPAMIAAINFLQPYEAPKELNVDSKEISGGYKVSSKKIRVGDLVRKV